jgi:hypothetical protein
MQLIATKLTNLNESRVYLRIVPEGYCVMKEGMASILQKGNDVFYNKAQVNTSIHPSIHPSIHQYNHNCSHKAILIAEHLL